MLLMRLKKHFLWNTVITQQGIYSVAHSGPAEARRDEQNICDKQRHRIGVKLVQKGQVSHMGLTRDHSPYIIYIIRHKHI